MSSTLSSAQIAATLELRDLILRNLHVTYGYHLLSQGMREVIGPDNASWVAFATYASKTAGQTIRHEILPEDLDRAFRSFRFYRRLLQIIRHFLSDESERGRELYLIPRILARISLSVSAGNIMVFSELAPPFAHMVTDFSQDDRPDSEKLDAFLFRFRPGPSSEGGQEMLKEAFSAYYHARFEPDPDRQAELIYLANLLIGYHEQQRLQPIIAESMHVPVDEVLGRPLRLTITPLGKRISDWIHRGFLVISRWVFAHIATQLFMAIYTPSGKLKLSLDVPEPASGETFPPELQTINSERVNELLDILDMSRDSLFGSRAANWAELDDRMNYIVDLFRSHQRDHSLFRPPFTARQIEALMDGRVPEGKL